MSTKRKRVNLSAGQKHEICEMKERDLRIQNVELAQKYNVGKSTITDILKESERWLTITESQGKVKKFRGPKWPQLEDALGLWVDNALNTKQDIDGNILKIKASYFAEQFSIEDFHHSEDETQEKLDSIDVKFLPPNTTTKLQPCDAGIIHSFKCHYNRLFLQNQINAYDDVQDGIVEELADYTIYDALQNAAEAWSMVTSQTISNCWKKTGILPQSDEFEEFSDDNDSVLSDSFDIEINELEVLISQFPKSDFNAYEYLHIEDEILEGGLTDHEIVDTIRNANREEENVVDEIELTHIMEKISPTEVEKAIDKTIRFLYEQGPEFGEVNEELKILRRLHKKVKVLIVKNLKQIDLHYFRYDNVI
ncbi:unnamed protein product [Rhizophagus irregularis]|nr:unnamed protein product [Rhizophagus irregularis]